jgi:AcrR family transcriptional regulator
MGIADRKAREKEELKVLTIRNIAESIDYSVGTVYVYFKDKSAILHALHTQGFRQLGGQFAVLNSVANPMERLRAMGSVYIRFALENPEMYDLMFSAKAPMEFLTGVDEEWKEGIAAFEALRLTVEQCMAAGHFAGHNPDPLTFMIWSLVHGMCSLEISHRTQSVDLANASTIVDQGYTEFLRILDKL